MEQSKVVARDYEVVVGDLASGEAREVRVRVERCCRAVRFAVDEGSWYRFRMHQLKVGRLSALAAREVEHGVLAAWGDDKSVPIDLDAGEEVVLGVSRIDGDAPFRGVLSVVEAGEGATDAEIARVVAGVESIPEWTIDFARIDASGVVVQEFIEPGKTVEISYVYGVDVGADAGAPEVIVPLRLCYAGNGYQQRGEGWEVSFRFKQYRRGDTMTVRAKNVGGRASNFIASVIFSVGGQR